MKIFNASDAKREFGELLLNVQHSPVGINKNGKPVAVVVSVAEFEALNAMRMKVELEKGLKDVEAGRIVDGETVIDRLRKRVGDGKL